MEKTQVPGQGIVLMRGHEKKRRVVVDVEAIVIFEDGFSAGSEILSKFAAVLPTVLKPQIEEFARPRLCVITAACQVPDRVSTDNNVRGRIVAKPIPPFVFLLVTELVDFGPLDPPIYDRVWCPETAGLEVAPNGDT